MATPEAAYVALGNMIDYTPAVAVSAGDVVVQSTLVGVAYQDIAADALGSLLVEGVFDFLYENGAAAVVGSDVYWDAANNLACAAAAVYLGKCVKAAAVDATTIRVKLIQQEAVVSAGTGTASA